MPYPNFLAFIISEILAFRGMDGQIDRRTWLVQLVLDQEYIYFIGSEALSSTCNTLFKKNNIPFYSTVYQGEVN